MAIDKIHFAGGGSIATALAMSVSEKASEIILVSPEHDVVSDINELHTNRKYFPAVKLSKRIKATSDIRCLKEAEIIFVAIPSVAVVNYFEKNHRFVNPDALIVNLAKGFSNDQGTIADSLQEKLPNRVCSLKGPSFAREIINKLPTGMTLGYENEQDKKQIRDLFRDTNILLDFSKDITGVELLSILKNIYAIAIGIVDAHFNSPNLRSLILTRAFNEMRSVLTAFGGKKKTLMRYCGFGDFILTSMNDLSRNRTLGLLIGKGFFDDNISKNVVLEGKIAVNIFCEQINQRADSKDEFPIIQELYKVFNEKYCIQDFITNIMNGEIDLIDD